MSYISSAAIECPALTADPNGGLSYSSVDQTGPFAIGTVATFMCNTDFSLNGASATLTCADDDGADNIGTWGGTEPACPGRSMLTRLYWWQVLELTSTHDLHLICSHRVPCSNC